MRLHYANLDLASALSASTSAAISERIGERSWFLGEWLLTNVAFGFRADEEEHFSRWHAVLDVCARPGFGRDELVDLKRNVIPDWARSWVDATNGADFDLVGLSSTFEQNVATLGLGRQIKESHPAGTLAYGGASFGGDMGP